MGTSNHQRVIWPDAKQAAEVAVEVAWCSKLKEPLPPARGLFARNKVAAKIVSFYWAEEKEANRVANGKGGLAKSVAMFFL
jgi:hypothetical protein